MKGDDKLHFKRILAIGVVIICLFSTSAFGAVDVSKSEDNVIVEQHQKSVDKKHMKRHRQFRRDFEKDPIKVLEKKKEKVRSLEKEGKITKEKADAIIGKIDKKIKEIKDFNNLTPEQKRERLTEKFEKVIERRVEEGKLTKKEADKLIRQFKKDVKEYDGKGYPEFLRKYFKTKRGSRVRGNKQ